MVSQTYRDYCSLKPWVLDGMERQDWMTKRFHLLSLSLRFMSEREGFVICDVCGQPREFADSALCDRCSWELPK